MYNLEQIMLNCEQADCPVMHHFFPGIYIREVKIPKGSIAIGHYQKTEHLNVFLKGKVTIVGDKIRTIEAPMMFMGKPGRKIGYIHEDVVWLNIYPTDEQNVEILEKTYLDKSEVFLEKEKQLFEDRQNYYQLINEAGYTEQEVKKVSEDEYDMTELPSGSYKFAISDSPIQGKGIWATTDIKKGEFIGPARIWNKRTILGRYSNHSQNPNSRMVFENGDINLYAIKDIHGMKGGLYMEEITTDYRENLKCLE